MASHERIPLLARLARHVGIVPDRTYSRESREMRPRIRDAEQTLSVCPYCAVGCSQIIFHKDGKLLDIEGNPNSPINAGTLCPKGAATYQLAINPLRFTKVKYRAPYSNQWEEKPLDWAMERIAQLVKQTRERTWEERDQSGKLVRRTLAIGHLGGATLDNEENYLIKKLFAALGIVWIENQARI
jgi:formate dehydrogenase major subunit